MTLFSDRDERILENLRIINSRFARKKKDVVRGERIAPSGGGMATVFVAAADASESSKSKADFQCNGSDDQAVWRRAAAAANYTGTLWLSEGTFDANLDGTPLEMYGAIRGLGREATYINAHGAGVANEHLIKLDGDSTLQDLAINIDGLIASGAAVNMESQENGIDNCHIDAGSGGCAVNVEAGVFSWIRSSYLYGDRAAVNFQSGYDFTMLDCRVEGVTYGVEDAGFGGPMTIAGSEITGDIGMRILSEMTLNGCIVHGNNGTALEMVAGERTNIIGNRFFGGITGDGQVDLSIIANHIQNAINAGIKLVGCTRPRVEVNRIFDTNTDPADTAAIVIDGTGASLPVRGFRIVDNEVEATNSHGIHILGGYSHGKVDGNKVTRMREHGILIEDLSESTIDANLIAWLDNLSGTNTWDGIILAGESDRNTVRNNTVVAEIPAGGPAARYGINISAATCNDTLSDSNYVYVAANLTGGAYNNAGTGTQGANFSA